jgi:hypothetical protein
MSLADLTEASVTRAVQEFDELGPDRFLNKYGFRTARENSLVVDGRRYPSKAIAGAAHGFARPESDHSVRTPSLVARRRSRGSWSALAFALTEKRSRLPSIELWLWAEFTLGLRSHENLGLSPSCFRLTEACFRAQRKARSSSSRTLGAHAPLTTKIGGTVTR